MLLVDHRDNYSDPIDHDLDHRAELDPSDWASNPRWTLCHARPSDWASNPRWSLCHARHRPGRAPPCIVLPVCAASTRCDRGLLYVPVPVVTFRVPATARAPRSVKTRCAENSETPWTTCLSLFSMARPYSSLVDFADAGGDTFLFVMLIIHRQGCCSCRSYHHFHCRCSIHCRC